MRRRARHNHRRRDLRSGCRLDAPIRGPRHTLADRYWPAAWTYTCGSCRQGWVCEEHKDQPWEHPLADGTACSGPGMPCLNPDCPLSWDNEREPTTGFVRPVESDEPWRLARPIRLFSER